MRSPRSKTHRRSSCDDSLSNQRRSFCPDTRASHQQLRIEIYDGLPAHAVFHLQGRTPTGRSGAGQRWPLRWWELSTVRHPEAPPFVESAAWLAPASRFASSCMKLFDDQLRVAGHIVQIGAENAELVEYGRVIRYRDLTRNALCRRLEGQKQSDRYAVTWTFDQTKKWGG